MSTLLSVDSHSALRLLKSAKRRLKQSLVPFTGAPGFHGECQWARIVMNRGTLTLIQRCNPESLSVLEIAGSFWKDRCRFRDYKALFHADYDVCTEPLPEKFDLVIAEQVFEHLLWPYRAGRNIYEMLRPGGLFLVTTPFLLKVHDDPQDCSRWTPTGMRYFLAECGFPLDSVEAYSWGNRSCVKGNFRRWQRFQRWRHSLAHEPDFPVVVWALAKKDD